MTDYKSCGSPGVLLLFWCGGHTLVLLRDSPPPSEAVVPLMSRFYEPPAGIFDDLLAVPDV